MDALNNLKRGGADDKDKDDPDKDQQIESISVSI